MLIDENYKFRKLNGDEVFKVFKLFKELKMKPYIEAQMKIAKDNGITDRKEVLNYILKDIIFHIIDNFDLVEDIVRELVLSYIDRPDRDFKDLDIDDIILSIEAMFKHGLGEIIKKFFSSGFLATKNV